MKNQKGFSLIELLVVVIIIAIIAAIAIPSLLASRKAANHSATVANLRTVVSAGQTYASLNSGVYAADFATLSGGTANYLDDSWTLSPVKNGYTYVYTPGTNNAAYCVAATPAAGAGDFHYKTSNQGYIWQSTDNASTCAVADGTLAGGAGGKVLGS